MYCDTGETDQFASFVQKYYATSFINYDSLPIFVMVLTLSPLFRTEVPSANSFDPDETASNSPSHPHPSCLTLRQHFHQL